MVGTVHSVVLGDAGTTRCCGISVVNLPQNDRLTRIDAQVTCPAVGQQTSAAVWIIRGIEALSPEKVYYLSGPMTGYKDYNYPAFEKARNEFLSHGMNIESPHLNPWPENHDSMDQETLWQEMMNLCEAQMERCDGIILMKGWPLSKGARRELGWALDAKKSVYYYHNQNLFDLN